MASVRDAIVETDGEVRGLEFEGEDLDDEQLGHVEF